MAMISAASLSRGVRSKVFLCAVLSYFPCLSLPCVRISDKKHPFLHEPRKKGCENQFSLLLHDAASKHLIFPAPKPKLDLSEVLDGSDHLAGVGVLVVVPRNNLNLIEVVSNLGDIVWVASNREPNLMPITSEETIGSQL